jgi:hypothetical protein
MLVNSSQYACALLSTLFAGFALGVSVSSFIVLTEKRGGNSR